VFLAFQAAVPVAYAEEEPDRRARDTEASMTDEERLGLIYSLMPFIATEGNARDPRVPEHVSRTAGWTRGVPRLGIPDLVSTDASLGVTNPGGGRPGDTATAMPAGLALGATFNPELAYRSGAAIAREARSRGFNVLLGGGMNLVREPRHGRNFEYISEDPWLSAVMAAEGVRGIQDQGVMATLKHVSLNAHEINKFWLDAVIDPVAHRESDLLAFQIAIERGQPASLMCAYNKVNGAYACGNDPILNGVVKDAWDYPGWIMSDWRAVYDWRFALAGLDQHSGAQLDREEWFVEALPEAMDRGEFPRERLSDMVRRILRSVYAVGVDSWEPQDPPDLEAHAAAALEVARQGIVLLKNDGVLPIPSDISSIAVIGGQADRGVIAGGGSSQGRPPGGYAATIPWGGETPLAVMRFEVYFPSSPLAELKALMPDAEILYAPGAYAAEAAALAERSDMAIVFATRFETEGFDSPDMTLPYGQDALIAAVAAANPNTVVVLETGNPIAMPWAGSVRAIVQAWFPGQEGGQAIAEVLSGAVNPSGHLPVTFPASVAQLPRPDLAGFGAPFGTPLTVDYHEGAEVGYRWFALKGHEPAYPFGHGLSYTTFAYEDLEVTGGDTVTARFTVVNTGERSGADVAQLYLRSAPDGGRMRLLGFERIVLAPGERGEVVLTADPRLLSRFDGGTGRWHLEGGDYVVAAGTSAGDLVLEQTVTLPTRTFGK
jgi:beta-glucosidase